MFSFRWHRQVVRQEPAKLPSLSSNLSATFTHSITMLHLIATPIGNLSDISFRAIEVLKSANLILCEDTRRSSILLSHYQIDKPLLSYHKFNEQKQLEQILNRLREKETIALISDAGTPCLNDPGSILVQACIKENIPFTSLPGPCSPINALLLSGLDASRFQFIGFLPKNPTEILKSIFGFPGTTIAFESPERLLKTLQIICKLDAQRKLAICREMTKKFEECKRGAAESLLTHFSEKGVKGEICILIEGNQLPNVDMEIDELVELLQEVHGLALKEAIKMAAKLLKKPKSEIYRSVHSI